MSLLPAGLTKVTLALASLATAKPTPACSLSPGSRPEDIRYSTSPTTYFVVPEFFVSTMPSAVFVDLSCKSQADGA
eukprot:4414199-Alexandrium_andersonii.AAC.1